MADYTVNEGMAAPAFSTASSEGGALSLANLEGKTVVLYFYPRDNTSGCTTEAKGFRDALADFAAAGAVVVGVSKDSLKSHANFKTKHELPFALLSDPELELIKAYDVWREKKMYGRVSMGVERATFLIDGEGTLRRVWRKVRVKDHVLAVLAAVRELT